MQKYSSYGGTWVAQVMILELLHQALHGASVLKSLLVPLWLLSQLVRTLKLLKKNHY